MRYYHIDSFSDAVFMGNPAGVCMLSDWPEDEVLRRIAAENNLSETAFVKADGERYEIRWFAPLDEVFLCGHATLAAAHALFAHEGVAGERVVFHSKRGELPVTRKGERLTLDFPLCELEPLAFDPQFERCFGKRPLKTYRANADYLFVFAQEDDVRNAPFDLGEIKKVQSEGIIITAPGSDCDFVSRCFAPQVGIDEDPVTGSAHTALCAYWREVLNKDRFVARQLSARGGLLECEVSGARVLISGSAVTYMKGEILLPQSRAQ